MHERCQPPVVHRHFTSGNVLLDDELAVCISDCGLAPIISSGSLSQVILFFNQFKFPGCFFCDAGCKSTFSKFYKMLLL